MKRIGTRIKAQREKRGWSIQQLAVRAGIDRGYLSKIETGKSDGRFETHQKLAGALGISVEGLYASEGNVEPAPLGGRPIPLLDYVQAGRWRGVVPAGEAEFTEQILADYAHPPSSFALRIKGDSMEPEFHEGDIVIISPLTSPVPGDYVVATDENGDATFKRYRSVGLNERGIDVFELQPLNPLYPRMRSDRQTLAIVGVMMEHHKYRRRHQSNLKD